MPDQVPEDVKGERLERLVEVIQRHARLRNEALVGTVQEVLVEGPSRTDPSTCRGKTRGGKTAIVAGSLDAGTLVPVRIEAATSQTLRGTVATPVPA
jgi:tRNA-2-methylthio-N6-dimethylallyladenosine synthase